MGNLIGGTGGAAAGHARGGRAMGGGRAVTQALNAAGKYNRPQGFGAYADGGAAPSPDMVRRLPFDQRVDYKQQELNRMLPPRHAASPAAREVARMATDPDNPFEMAGKVASGHVGPPNHPSEYPNQFASYGYGEGDAARDREHAERNREVAESVMWNMPVFRLAKMVGMGERILRALERFEGTRDPQHMMDEAQHEREKHEAVEDMLKHSHEMYHPAGHRRGGTVTKKALHAAKSRRRVAAR
jgi:hypothetical protein